MIDLSKARNKDLFFQPVVKYLVRFVVLSSDSPVGSPGEEIIVFLTEEAYRKYLMSLKSHLVIEIEHHKYDEHMCLIVEENV